MSDPFDLERFVRAQNGGVYEQALRELGRPVEYLELAGEGHEYRRVESRTALVARMLAFLREHLGA